MATLVLSTIGNAIGSAIGGPIGGAIGQAAGSALGGALSGSGRKTRFVEGPRLSDVAGLTSTEGVMPLTYIQDYAGIISRTVQDQALLLNTIADQNPNDATQELFAGTSSPEQVAQTIEDAAATELAP